MNMLFILAQAAQKQQAQIIEMDIFWQQITKLSWLQGLVAVSFGAVYQIGRAHV
jgi:hypothetical protein